MNWLLVIFCAYLVVMLIIGAVASRYARSVEGFFLAGRSQGSWVTAVSSAASSESGWVTLGLVGMGYAHGLSATWFVLGCLGGFVLNWLLVAPRLRRLSRVQGSLTVPDFLEARTPGGSSVRVVAVIIIFLCMMGYVAAQLTAAGKTFTVVFEQDYRAGVLIGATITIAYTLLGGYRAVAWTDLLQGLLMVVGLVVLPVYLIFFHAPWSGLGGLEQAARQAPPRAILKLELGTGGLVPNKATGYLEGGTLWLSGTACPTAEEGIFARQGHDACLSLAGLPSGRLGLGVPEGRTLLPADPKNATARQPVLVLQNDSPEDLRQGAAPSERIAARAGASAEVPLEGLSELRWGTATIGSSTLEVAPGAERVDLFGGKVGLALLGLILGALGIGLGYPGQPHVLTRYMAAENRQAIARGRVIAIAWGVLALFGAVWLGHAGRLLMPALEDPELAYPMAATTFLPAAVAGLLVAAIIAAIMSTADSQLLVAASAISRDIYQKTLKRNEQVSDKRIVLISRLVVLVLGLLALATALGEARVVFWFELLAWSGLGASFGPPVLLGLFWRRLSRQGVLAAMVTGFLVTLLWKLWIRQRLAAWGLDLYELVPAFFLSTLAAVLVSLLTSPPPNAEQLLAQGVEGASADGEGASADGEDAR